MSEFKVLFAEGSAVNRPPMFNGMNYAFWKVRMQIFMESIDVLIWEAVVHGPYVPMQVVKDEEVVSQDLNGMRPKGGRLNMIL